MVACRIVCTVQRLIFDQKLPAKSLHNMPKWPHGKQKRCWPGGCNRIGCWCKRITFAAVTLVLKDPHFSLMADLRIFATQVLNRILKYESTWKCIQHQNDAFSLTDCFELITLSMSRLKNPSGNIQTQGSDLCVTRGTTPPPTKTLSPQTGDWEIYEKKLGVAGWRYRDTARCDTCMWRHVWPRVVTMLMLMLMINTWLWLVHDDLDMN